MGCGTRMVKYILFFFNFIFVVGGIALVTLGALTYARFKEYEDLAGEFGFAGVQGPPIAMMVGGTIVFFIAFMGCCGAIRESHMMMSTYGTILTILLILEVGAVIGVAVYKDDVEKGLKEGLTRSMQNYQGESAIDKEQTAIWDNMQERVKCCGTNSYEDWSQSPFQKVPPSCCKDKLSSDCSPEGIPFPALNTNTIYTDGCYDKAISEIGIPMLIAVAAGIAGVELLGVVFGCCLAARFRNKDYRPR